MAEEPTPLDQRLRDVAGRIAFDECGKWFNPPRFGPTQKQVGAVIAATLLRELVAHVRDECPDGRSPTTWRLSPTPSRRAERPMDDKPYNPAVGDMVIATDAHGQDHEVRVVRGPWRGQANTFVKVTVLFVCGDMMPWPLSAVRPLAALGIQEGGTE